MATPLPQPEMPHPSPEQELSRRSFLRSAALVGAGAALGILVDRHLNDGESDAPGEPGDVLVDPDKFTRFIDEYQPVAEELADKDSHIPFEVYLAVAMHESDSGTSELANYANNFFGVIAKDGWTGEVYKKPTQEEVANSDIPSLQQQYGTELAVLSDYGDGRSRVQYPRPFRKYPNARASFEDFASKLYFQNTDGSYRYADLVDYIQSGGRNPYEVTRLMTNGDSTEPKYATGREWIDGVHRYIKLIQDKTGKKSENVAPPAQVEEDTLPKPEDKIDIEVIDFSGLNETRDKALIETMKQAMDSTDLDAYRNFQKSGIKDMSEFTKSKVEDADYYQRKYDSRIINPRFIVWHTWAIGVKDSGTPEQAPTGRSHDISLEQVIESWKNASDASCGYLLSDNDDGELWQLTPHPFSRTLHVGNGIADEGKNTHGGVGNDTAIGIEVQADSIYDVTPTQLKQLLLFTTDRLFAAGILKEGMTRDEVNAVVDASVIGHGKNDGIEFGYRYSRPLIQALQQFAFIAIRA